MIVERWTVQIKPDWMEEALKHAKEGKKTVWPNFKSSKIYSSYTGPFNIIEFEAEFEDLAEVEESWKQLGETEAWNSWLTKWRGFITGQGTREYWNLEDS